MRVLGTMVVRNEADRYLDACLTWHRSILDAIFVYDDHSSDETVEVALSHGCEVTRRPDNVPAFLAHEGQCRAGAWHAFEDALHPVVGDWVLALDADETLVSDRRDEADALWSNCIEATETGCSGVVLPIPEVFGLSRVGEFLIDPYVRIDGAWGSIRGPRLFRYEPNGAFADKAMGSGSEPTYVARGQLMAARALFLMHYGYADALDVKIKYERYASMAHGHSNAHVESIPEDPLLTRWDGPTIPIWRGRRT